MGINIYKKKIKSLTPSYMAILYKNTFLNYFCVCTQFQFIKCILYLYSYKSTKFLRKKYYIFLIVYNNI